ncbi:MAG: NAD(+) diphosphatase [Alphaproteobacteria bacterium]
MTTPHALGFARNPLVRCHNQRADPGWVAEMQARPDALVLMFAGDRPLLRTNPDGSFRAVFTRALADQMEQRVQNIVLLGVNEAGVPVRAHQYGEVDAPDDPNEQAQVPPPATMVRGLRSLAVEGILPGSELSLLALGKAMLSWHISHRFCSNCASPTEPALGGFRRDCPGCGRQHFPRTDPVVIMLVTHEKRALLASSPNFSTGMFSAIAGFVEPGETIEEAVRRETAEETGLEVGAVSYLMSQPWPFASSLMIGCYARASSDQLDLNPAELAAAHWMTKPDLRAALAGEGDISLPPPFAIAHHLVLDFVNQN